jgi:uncharacterized protein YyaL (SSP411 family)
MSTQSIKATNRLAGEKSPYLLQHAGNPVAWLPWGQEAFEKARSEDKPIFLSIGYSTCHWCHVMAHESFENEATARLLNEHFVSIKVDREERPDVDRVYMAFVQATTGSGGWPMSVFLTPDLKPIVGGTYFPPEDRYGRAGFPTVLLRVSEAWREHRAELVEQGEKLVEALRSNQLGQSGSESELPPPSVFEAAFTQARQTFDPQYGGFGTAPKFPRPSYLNLLVRCGNVMPEHKGAEAREMALATLDKMAAGGIHDHLGGGFHRYSVDRFWHVPHFEKMLYDQAQLVVSYLEAFQITGRQSFAKVARSILEYVERDLTSGGFYSAEDADSPSWAAPAGGLCEAAGSTPGSQSAASQRPPTVSGEGLFYLWSKTEIGAALSPKEAEVLNRYYGVEPVGNAPEGSDPQGEFVGQNILIQRLSLRDLAASLQRGPEEVAVLLAIAHRKLFEIRGKRPRPHLDDKIITAWNGLMISAFARAAQVLGEPNYLERAIGAAEFVRDNLMRDDFTLLRSWREGAGEVQGFADDYAFLIQALLDLYEASANIEWLILAVALQRRQNALFADLENGGYYAAIADDPTLFLRMKEDHDGAEPSANSVSALNLLRLEQMAGIEEFGQFGRKTIAAFGSLLKAMPSAMPQMLVALQFATTAPKQIVVAGDPKQAQGLLRQIHARFAPNKVILFADGGEGQQWLGQQREFIRSLSPVDHQPTAYVCENFACQLPVTDPEKLGKLLG